MILKICSCLFSFSSSSAVLTETWSYHLLTGQKERLNAWNWPKSDGVWLEVCLEGINRSKEPQKTHLPFLAGLSGAQVSKGLRSVWSRSGDINLMFQRPCKILAIWVTRFVNELRKIHRGGHQSSNQAITRPVLYAHICSHPRNPITKLAATQKRSPSTVSWIAGTVLISRKLFCVLKPQVWDCYLQNNKPKAAWSVWHESGEADIVPLTDLQPVHSINSVCST